MALAKKGIDVRESQGHLMFRAFLQDSTGAIVTSGTTSLYLYEVQDNGTLKSYDFNDNTFKTTALTTETLAMTHRTGNNGGTNTGIWTVALSTLTGFTTGGIYFARVKNTGASPTDQVREFQFGGAEGDLLVSSAFYIGADTRAISEDATAADRLETMLDGTGGNTFSLANLNLSGNFSLVNLDASGYIHCVGFASINPGGIGMQIEGDTAGVSVTGLSGPAILLSGFGGVDLISSGEWQIGTLDLTNFTSAANTATTWFSRFIAMYEAFQVVTIDALTFTPTTTVFEIDDAVDSEDKYTEQVLLGLTGANRGVTTPIESYVYSGNSKVKLTVEALPAAPAGGDTFLKIGRIEQA